MKLGVAPHTIRNLWCIGRNYSEHAKELGNEVPTKPLVFLKAGSSIQPSSSEIIFPSWAKDIHYELELAVQWNEDLKVKRGFLAIDFTERTLQSELKTKGHPWTLAKSFSGATAISEDFDIENLDGFEMELLLNDERKQHGFLTDMIFSISTLVEYIETHFPVCPGDLLLTGTPSGVGPVKFGDKIAISCNRGISAAWKVQGPKR